MCTAEHVVEGPVDGPGVRNTKLHEVDDLHDGQAAEVQTRDVDVR